jgi:cobalt-zinc-cadmium efflux system protein
MLHPCAFGCDHSIINPQIKQRRFAIALFLVSSFAIAEFLIGLISGSLSLIAESGHMASDSLAFALALMASWVTQLPKANSLSDSLATITPHQSWETWAALINGISLLGLALWVGWEAIHQLQTPLTEIASTPMLFTAAVGCVISSINIAILHQGSEHDLNLRAVLLHVFADAISSFGVILAAIAVALLNWLWADKVISLFVATLTAVGAISLIFQSSKQLFLANSLAAIGNDQQLIAKSQGITRKFTDSFCSRY